MSRFDSNILPGDPAGVKKTSICRGKFQQKLCLRLLLEGRKSLQKPSRTMKICTKLIK